MTSAINYQAAGMNGRQRALVLFLAFLIGAVGVGYKVREVWQRREVETRQKGTIRQFNELMKGYFEGDVEQAVKCLQQAAGLLEGDTHVEPIGRAQLLQLTYFHLYVLEKRARNELAAEAALIKAQYWRLKRGELLGVDVEKAMEQLRQSTPERIFEYIDDFDRRHNNGREPAYIRFTQKAGNVVPGQGEAVGVDRGSTPAK